MPSFQYLRFFFTFEFNYLFVIKIVWNEAENHFQTWLISIWLLVTDALDNRRWKILEILLRCCNIFIYRKKKSLNFELTSFTTSRCKIQGKKLKCKKRGYLKLLQLILTETKVCIKISSKFMLSLNILAQTVHLQKKLPNHQFFRVII